MKLYFPLTASPRVINQYSAYKTNYELNKKHFSAKAKLKINECNQHIFNHKSSVYLMVKARCFNYVFIIDQYLTINMNEYKYFCQIMQI